MREVVLIVLCALPFVLIGFLCGVILARNMYIQTFKWQRKQIRHFQRQISRFAPVHEEFIMQGDTSEI